MPSKDCVIHPEIEPRIITVDILKSVLAETIRTRTPEAARILKEEGIPWEEIEYIRIEFKNILRIDNLWMLTGLKKLVLSNNRIETIENLDLLVNLTYLDLSNNFITKIEHLKHLTNIEILLLYKNRIKKIQNLQSLEKLLIFNMGENLIEDMTEILYLRTFDHLRSVNFAGNPCCDNNPDFRQWVIAFLPQIHYNEYRMVLAEERELALKEYENEIEIVIESEKEIFEERERKRIEKEEEIFNISSFVEFLGDTTLFDRLFENDIDGQLLLSIPVPAIDTKYMAFKEQFCKITRELFEMGQESAKKRQVEVDQFNKCVDREKERTELESQKIVEQFVDAKRELIAELYTSYDAMEEEEINAADPLNQQGIAEFQATTTSNLHTFNRVAKDVWKKLMNCEMLLHSQLEEVNENFSILITEMITYFLEHASNYFAELRYAEKDYNEVIVDLTMEYSNELQLNSPNRSSQSVASRASTITDGQLSRRKSRQLERRFADKDNVINICSGSHDYHNLQIDLREDRLVQRAKAWLNDLVSHLEKNEIQRDRDKVLEIVEFMDEQKQTFMHTYAPFLADDDSSISEKGEEEGTTFINEESDILSHMTNKSYRV